jgi:hypothetical protein
MCIANNKSTVHIFNIGDHLLEREDTTGVKEIKSFLKIKTLTVENEWIERKF